MSDVEMRHLDDNPWSSSWDMTDLALSRLTCTIALYSRDVQRDGELNELRDWHCIKKEPAILKSQRKVGWNKANF